MFEKARADAEAPLRAARVFGNIVQAVNEAEEAAKRAKKAAEDSIRLVRHTVYYLTFIIIISLTCKTYCLLSDIYYHYIVDL
ncbi:hypothetical protein KUTeg_016596 [Tegillarca granosa]|uniref:Uncharacterized protein n=1 Tax=Tegillarca granosa TaxID=220873 RepID=A0ABQ9ELC2_TEGGR|nr:hypothetical protein KUTeg_016596 [Tegillarca granosa]